MHKNTIWDMARVSAVADIQVGFDKGCVWELSYMLRRGKLLLTHVTQNMKNDHVRRHEVLLWRLLRR